jgi:tetraacyldisaccharide 4'-kinase
LGGTGKSPCVEFVLKKLLNKKRKVGLLTTGYGRKIKNEKGLFFSQEKDNLNVEEMGDESYLFSKHFPQVPIFVSRNRAESFLHAIEKRECDVFVMDDGFQYPSIDKDLEILLINKRNPFGNGYLFPGGTLREPIDSMKRADLIILTHTDECSLSLQGNDKDIHSILSEKVPQVPILESIHKPLYFEDGLSGQKYKLEELIGKKLLSLSSLADPLSFEESLRKLGINILKKIRFPDHYIYKPEDIEWLFNVAQKENVDFIVTTEKDWVRFPKGFKILVPTLCLVIDFQVIKGEDKLDNLLNQVLQEYKA